MMEKKQNEYDSALFFLQHLNRKYGFDYEPEANFLESSVDEYVDVYARSAVHPPIKLQVTTGQPHVPRMFAEARRVAKRSGGGYAFVSTVLSVPDMIEGALILKDKYAEAQKRELVLLVNHDYGMPFKDENYVKSVFGKFASTDFKGVYLVTRPSASYQHEGEIVAIKNCFGDNNTIF